MPRYVPWLVIVPTCMVTCMVTCVVTCMVSVDEVFECDESDEVD